MTSHDLSCPQCSAHISPGADWCTLCFADLRVAPAPEAEIELEAPAEPVAIPEQAGEQSGEQSGEQAGEQAGEQPAGRHGKHARSATSYVNVMLDGKGTPHDPAEEAALEARAAEMLAMLAAQTSHPLGPVAARLSSTSSRVVAAVFGGVLLVVVVLLAMTLLGHFI